MNQTRREWLLSGAPQTRRQARLSAYYQSWLTFRGNKLAMLGLIVLVLLVAQDLPNRLQPPLAKHWLGTDTLAGTSCAA